LRIWPFASVCVHQIYDLSIFQICRLNASTTLYRNVSSISGVRYHNVLDQWNKVAPWQHLPNYVPPDGLLSQNSNQSITATNLFIFYFFVIAILTSLPAANHQTGLCDIQLSRRRNEIKLFYHDVNSNMRMDVMFSYRDGSIKVRSEICVLFSVADNNSSIYVGHGYYFLKF